MPDDMTRPGGDATLRLDTGPWTAVLARVRADFDRWDRQARRQFQDVAAAFAATPPDATPSDDRPRNPRMT